MAGTLIEVWRVECPRGHGMYTGDNYVANDMMDRTTHPTPKEDYLLMQNMHVDYECPIILHEHRFGFESAAQLLRWVYRYDWRDYLDRDGYKVHVFDAQGWKGHTQAVYLNWSRTPSKKILSLLDL